MNHTNILVADDEPRIRRLVSDFLTREGYSVVEAEDGQAALDTFFARKDIDLVVLDVMMPKLDGWVVCREIRKSSGVPVIMLTARSEENDELFGFDLGADDYVTKPFSPKVLVARVQAQLRRGMETVHTAIEAGGILVDETAHRVLCEGESVELSPKEFELLHYLMRNKGVALSRDQILDAVWNYDYFGDARTVDTHIKKLRLKLGTKGELIGTVRGHGYRFDTVIHAGDDI